MTQAIQWNGKTITEPGIYTGISLEDYHNKLDLLDAPSVSKSALKHIFPSLKGSPKQFWNLWKFNPQHVVKKPSKEMDLGKAVHALMLGDEVFVDKFAVQPEEYPDKKTGGPKPWSNNAGFCKNWNEEQAESGKTVVTLEQIEKITRMAEDAARDPMVQQGILNGLVEQSMFVKDEKTGLWFRSRIDNLAVDGFYADLKTTSSMDERFIRKHIRDNGYFIQAGGARLSARTFGLPFDSFWNIYVSTADTPDTQAIELDPEVIDAGEQAIRVGLDRISECMKTGIWPGARPCDGRPIRMGDYAMQDIENDLKSQDLEQAA
ncbi:PD-(D/E)XK nuclease-like domain-containing protein [Roseibium album]|uniref:PD-(D/E)XK nuclease-like domain-containing protein n=1 Tax=Roseibium album TaxID=311410 RepID=UPI00391C36B5